ncbi:hypothetical protein Dimus_005199, partial [Dionaea muscipula]
CGAGINQGASSRVQDLGMGTMLDMNMMILIAHLTHVSTGSGWLVIIVRGLPCCGNNGCYRWLVSTATLLSLERLLVHDIKEIRPVTFGCIRT